MTRPQPSRSPSRVLLVSVLAALGAAAMWGAWLGWDHTYYLVDGVEHGPYRPWQVVGCGVSVAAVCVVARVFARHTLGLTLIPAATAVGFTVPWSIDASANDVTGLWAVGLIMILPAGFVGLLLVVLVTDAVLGGRAPKDPARTNGRATNGGPTLH